MMVGGGLVGRKLELMVEIAAIRIEVDIVEESRRRSGQSLRKL
jgi:hypothetical protein